MGVPLAGGVQPLSAIPIERVTSFTRLPSAIRSSSDAPASDAAATALMTKKLPATPRRPTVHVLFCTATSSLTNSVLTVTPSASSISVAISNAIRSPL